MACTKGGLGQTGHCGDGYLNFWIEAGDVEAVGSMDVEGVVERGGLRNM